MSEGNPQPAVVHHPGRIVARELAAREWSIMTLELHAAVNFWTLHDVVEGRGDITPDIACGLARAFGTSPDLWLNMQREYDAWKERER